MSIESERPQSRLLEGLFNPPQATVAGKSQAALEEEVAELKDRLHEERFGWIVLCIILFDTAVWANVQTTGVPIAIMVFQGLLLLVLARRLGIQEIVRLFDRLVEGWTSRGVTLPQNQDPPRKPDAASDRSATPTI